MIRKIILGFTFATLSLITTALSAQVCTPDTSLHKPGYKPSVLPVVKVNVSYTESISVLVKRDTYTMVGPTKVNVKIDSVRATGVLGLPTGFSYQCQHPRCVFLWDTVRCVKIYGLTTDSGTFPIRIPIIGYAKVGSSSYIQKDTIKDFTLIVQGTVLGTANLQRLNGWQVFPQPAKGVITIYSEKHVAASEWFMLDMQGRKTNVQFTGSSGIYRADVSLLPAGLYMVCNGKETKKIIVSGE